MINHTSIPTPCSVYVIQAKSGACKIGIANDPAARLREIQMYNHEPLKTIYVLQVASREIAFGIEALLHQRYAAHAVHGEWFYVVTRKLVEDIQFATAFARIIKSFSVEDEKGRVSYSRPVPTKREYANDSELALAVIERTRKYGQISAAVICKEYGTDIETAEWVIQVLLKNEFAAPSTDDPLVFIFDEQKYRAATTTE